MNDQIHVLAPFNNVNDETVILVEWHLPDKAAVKKGEIILSFETSKAIVELEAPADGFLIHKVKVAEEIPIGGVLAIITSTLPNAKDNSSCSFNTDIPSVCAIGTDHTSNVCHDKGFSQTLDDRQPRFTPVAKRMIDKLGIKSSNFTGMQLVRTDDVLTMISNSQQETSNRLWPVTRFTQKALLLMKEHSISEENFMGVGLVRSEDVLARLEPTSSSEITSNNVTASDTNVTYPFQYSTTHSQVPTVGVRKETVSKRKKAEIGNLSIGQSASVTSNITIACNTKGFRLALQSQSVLLGNPTALIMYEVARLLKLFPELNAYYASGDIFFYEEINIGFAIDAGFGLKVPVIRNADQKSLNQIAEEMNSCIHLYLDDKLTPDQLVGGTFTISDLSGEGVFTFFPLISNGQSAILGIGGEIRTNGIEDLFTLSLSFDHQAADGRMASQFLNRLKQHLTAYENSLSTREAEVTPEESTTILPYFNPSISPAEELACHRCLRDINSLANLNAYLVPTVNENKSVRLICTICMGGF